MRALICGGRDFGRLPMRADGNGPDRTHPAWERRYAQYNFGKRILYLLLTVDSVGTEPNETWLPPSDLVIIHGGATGADTIADEWAVVNWVSCKSYPADWTRWGKRAGFIRNRRMLVDGKPDLVIAFPGGTGTASMVLLAHKAGVTTIEVPYHDPI